MNAKKICSKCGAEIAKPSSKFCPECGASLDDAMMVKSKCPGCGAEVKPGAKFCPECGMSLLNSSSTNDSQSTNSHQSVSEPTDKVQDGAFERPITREQVSEKGNSATGQSVSDATERTLESDTAQQSEKMTGGDSFSPSIPGMPTASEYAVPKRGVFGINNETGIDSAHDGKKIAEALIASRMSQVGKEQEEENDEEDNAEISQNNDPLEGADDLS